MLTDPRSLQAAQETALLRAANVTWHKTYQNLMARLLEFQVVSETERDPDA